MEIHLYIVHRSFFVQERKIKDPVHVSYIRFLFCMDDEYKERPSLFGHVNNLLNYCWLALARQHTAYYSCQSGKKSKILPDVRSEPCAVDFYPGQFRNNNHAHIIWLSYHQLGSTPEITMQTGI